MASQSRRGRPKGQTNDNRSYGPLGDLIRKYRKEKGLGLLEVAKACKCSVQFISNIEHGRAPLPWEKAEKISKILEIPIDEIQSANLAMRSEFQSFVVKTRTRASTKSLKYKKASTAINSLRNAASLVALTAQDESLRELLEKYQAASQNDRKKFLESAQKLF